MAGLYHGGRPSALGAGPRGELDRRLPRRCVVTPLDRCAQEREDASHELLVLLDSLLPDSEVVDQVEIDGGGGQAACGLARVEELEARAPGLGMVGDQDQVNLRPILTRLREGTCVEVEAQELVNVCPVLHLDAEQAVKRRALRRMVGWPPHEEIRQEIALAVLEDLLNVALPTDSADLVACMTEHVLHECFRRPSLEKPRVHVASPSMAWSSVRGLKGAR